MTCKDCVHYDRCAWFADKIARNRIFIDFNIKVQAVEEKCQHFKNKENFIEVPLKVGGNVYKISRNKIKKCEVVFIGISADEICSYFNFVEKYADGTFYKSYSMVFDVIGKTVFLTKEEAEKALKMGVK